jgi:hypothetical protein
MTKKDKIKELAAIYNTFGLDNFMAKEAERVLLNNDLKGVAKARELAAMARHIQ